ncbi:hypothetical protein L9F63_008611, partial [Diploptera punctata]
FTAFQDGFIFWCLVGGYCLYSGLRVCQNNSFSFSLLVLEPSVKTLSHSGSGNFVLMVSNVICLAIDGFVSFFFIILSIERVVLSGVLCFEVGLLWVSNELPHFFPANLFTYGDMELLKLLTTNLNASISANKFLMHPNIVIFSHMISSMNSYGRNICCIFILAYVNFFPNCILQSFHFCWFLLNYLSCNHFS